MINAVDLILGEERGQMSRQLIRRFRVMAEWLFNDDASPSPSKVNFIQAMPVVPLINYI